MSKIIIENKSSKSDLIALMAVRCVIEAGRVSNDGKHYCYFSTFKQGISVSSFLNKKSDRFVVNNYQEIAKHITSPPL